jgi:isopenicillin N synthase-like dioxygenase
LAWLGSAAAFVVTIGDSMTIASGGECRAAPHRVVLPAALKPAAGESGGAPAAAGVEAAAAAAGSGERLSVAFFVKFRPDQVVRVS